MRKTLFIIVTTLLILPACSAANENFSRQEPPAEPDLNVQTAEKTVGRGAESQNPSAQQISLDQTANSQNQPLTTERKIIRNADIRLETSSPEETRQKIAAAAESRKGFVVETSQSSSNAQTGARDTINMTIRVPAEKFDETLGEIRAAGDRVIQETVKGQDVTEEFIDIEARLKAKRALEEQFLEIMKRSTTVSDALNVQKELAEVRGEIEKIEGRKRFLENQAALSTIRIQMLTPASLSANPSGFFYELKEAVSTGFNAALQVVLFLVTAAIALLPFLIFIILPIYLLLRYLWRKRLRRRSIDKIVREEVKVE